MTGVTYRTITRPSDGGRWTNAADWVQWVNSERLCPSVAPRHPESCSLCYGAVGYRDDSTVFPFCWPCQNYLAILDGAIPIAYSISDGLESLLHRFKDFVGSYSWMAAPLASVAVTFLSRHYPCIQSRYGEVGVLTVVPSGNAARTRNHLETVLSLTNAWPAAWRMDVLTKVQPGRPGRGEVIPGFYRADSAIVSGKAVLIFDDTWTSGSSIANCALALKEAGAATVISVTIGRQLHAGFGSADTLIAEARRRTFQVDRCVLCG